MERCVVTGASGLVGRELASVLAASGRRVVAWQRSPTPASAAAGNPSIECQRVALAVTAAADIARLLAGVDTFIHCAWDLDVSTWADIERVNVGGSIAWFDAAARTGVRKLVFVSSVSAYPGCASMYGRSKLLVEEAVARHGGVNVRPGIVHGDPSRGVYGRLWQSTNASLIPLIDGGHQRMLTVHREDLAKAIARILDDYARWKGRTVAIGHPELVSLRGILACMLRARGRTGRFVTVPSRPVLMGLRAAERVGAKLRFRSDSLLTLMGEEPAIDRAALKELNVPLRSLEDALAGSHVARV